MEITPIRSVHNPRVKAWARLLTRKGRDSQGSFLIEGVHLVQEALRSGVQLEVIVYSEERGWPSELEQPTGIECVSTTEAVLQKCTDAKTPQAVFAIAPQHAIIEQDYRSATDPFRKEKGLCLVIDGIRDPGNLGTLIRSADAVGADGVLIGENCVDLFHPKTVRATMGSLFHVPIRRGDLQTEIEEAKRLDTQIVGASGQASKHCYEIDWTRSSWIVIGNEAEGISPSVRASLTTEAAIPMNGSAESLNAGMAATVLLYEAFRQRHYSN